MHIPAMMSPWRPIRFTLSTDRPFIFILEHRSLNLISLSLKVLHYQAFIRRFYTESLSQLDNYMLLKNLVLKNVWCHFLTLYSLQFENLLDAYSYIVEVNDQRSLKLQFFWKCQSDSSMSFGDLNLLLKSLPDSAYFLLC